MTEEKWFQTNDPVVLLNHLKGSLGSRKLRLFGVACCRTHWHLLTEPASRGAVEWAEQFADGIASVDNHHSRLDWESEGAAFGKEEQYESERSADHAEEQAARYYHFDRDASPVDSPPSNRRRSVTVAFLANHLMTVGYGYDGRSYRAFTGVLNPFLVRDVFGNPFRPVTFDAAWQTTTAISLAQTMYDSRDFAAMPVLADALENAGCAVPDMLAHCRDPKGVHVRGCWVVDLVLGKS
jgi:hypothetical protein